MKGGYSFRGTFMHNGRLYIFLIGMVLGIVSSTHAQEGVVDYYNFDGCQFTSNSTGVSISPLGGLGCDCGFLGDALSLDGNDDGVDSIFINNNFFEQDFSIRFYFLPFVGDGSFDILSKKEECVGDNSFTIRYDGTFDQIVVEITETIGSSLFMVGEINLDNCWHEVVFMRRDDLYFLFVDGIQEERVFVELGISALNDAPVRISAGPCVPAFENRFEGLFDELSFFNRSLLLNEIGAEIRSDYLVTKDTLIFNGGSVPIRSQANCADQFSWSPTTGVSNPAIANPVLSPTVSTTYEIEFVSDQCTTIDSIRVVVIEREDLECSQLDLPSAFTPNGDGINDVFGISNPFIIDQLESFDVYDRHGGIVYSFLNPSDKWNGSYGDGERLMPGIYVFKIRYTCLSEEQLVFGTVALMR